MIETNEFLQKCYKCGNMQMKIISFLKIKIEKMDLIAILKFVVKSYSDENREKKRFLTKNFVKIQKYHTSRKEGRNIYEVERRRRYIKFKLICNVRNRTNQTSRAQNMRKLIKTFVLTGCSHSLFRRWIIQQLNSNMNGENYGSLWNIDPRYPPKLNLYNEKHFYKSTNWTVLRPMYINKNSSEIAKTIRYFYLLQENKAKHLLKINEKDLIKIFVAEIFSKRPKKKYRSNEITYNHIDEFGSIDLADKLDYKSSNYKGLRYIFVIFEKSSKYIWYIPLKNRNSQTTVDEV